MTNEYCAMGALAKSVGATDEFLRKSSATGIGIWKEFGVQLKDKYGIESLEQFQELMHSNDGSSVIERRDKVTERALIMSVEEINSMISESQTVSAE